MDVEEPIELNIPDEEPLAETPIKVISEPESEPIAVQAQVQEQQQISQITLRKFYRMRAKQPSLYGYDGRGNLVERDSNGSVKTTIPLPKYRPLNPSEIAELETSRREAIVEAEDKYNTAMEELRQAIKDFNAGRVLPNAVKDAQLAVQEADIIRSRTMYPEYFVRVLSGLDFKDIYEDARINRKIDFNVFQAQVCDHRLRSLWSKEMTVQEEQEEEEEEAPVEPEEDEEVPLGQVGGSSPLTNGPDSNVVIIFNRPDDNEYGYLANDWSIEFNWKGIKYFTVDQALAAAKAQYYGRPEDVKEIMKTRSTTTMRSIARKMGEAPGQHGSLVHAGGPSGLPQQAETPNERVVREQRNAAWEKERYNILVSLLLAKFRQNPQIGKLLIETGDAILARADHRDIEDGIGIAITDPRAGHQSKWRGKNLLGKALMDARFQLRTGNKSEDSVVDEETDIIKKKTISAEDAEAAAKAKTATIINKRRQGFTPTGAQSFQKPL
jgi:predicted NAD-dependent protein-ADP-ribosyltransferase YbiA (DUF1768 family)